jgi:hypothetical protein
MFLSLPFFQERPSTIGGMYHEYPIRSRYRTRCGR